MDRESFDAIVNRTGYASLHVEEDFNCDHSFLKSHSCCNEKVKKSKTSRPAWNGFFAYMRKSHCLKQVAMKEDKDDPYEYVIIVRPDLLYFEAFPYIQELVKNPDRL